MEASEVDYKPLEKNPKHIHWLLSAIISMICLGVGPFLCGLSSYNPLSVISMISVGQIILAVAFYLIFQHTISITQKKLQEITEEASSSKSFAPGVYLAICSGIIQGIGQWALIWGFYYDENGRGILSSIISAQGVLSSILGYIYFKERLLHCEWFGMLISLGGMIVISLSSSRDSTFIGVILSIIGLIAFSVRNVFTRKSQMKGLSIYSVIFVNLIAFGVSGLLVIAVALPFGYDPFSEGWKVLVSLTGGILIGMGAYFICQACMTGPIGPSVTIANMCGIVQIFLDFVFLDIVPDETKLIGACITIGGAVLLAVGDSVIEKFKNKKKSYED
ncbi:unnamed protein product [Blepharisma stoltei]|uniref:EamA domain-containing protein n=1 Tax=Blepharisma stoltei TaxID=1481888 RepID=A0AAU9JVL7_9CILI|nr:unnamed protein product [Blepharisma stoltei]